MTAPARPPRPAGCCPAARPAADREDAERRLPLGRQIAAPGRAARSSPFTVLFPIIWIVSMSLDPRNLARPDGLNLIPPGASLDAFAAGHRPADEQPDQLHRARPQQPQDRHRQLADRGRASGSWPPTPSRASGSAAARSLMIAVLGVLMLPSVATIIPLFIFLNQFQIDFGDLSFNLRNSLARRGAGGHLGAAAVRDLEPEGLPRHDPARTSRRRPRSTARPRTRSSARSSCRWPCRPSR